MSFCVLLMSRRGATWQPMHILNHMAYVPIPHLEAKLNSSWLFQSLFFVLRSLTAPLKKVTLSMKQVQRIRSSSKVLKNVEPKLEYKEIKGINDNVYHDTLKTIPENFKNHHIVLKSNEKQNMTRIREERKL